MKARAEAEAIGRRIFKTIGHFYILDALVKVNAFTGERGVYYASLNANIKDAIRVLSL